MKRTFTLLVAVLYTAVVFAQAPDKMNYQAVIRNASNALVANRPVGIRVSILQGSATGTVVYNEIFNPNLLTNANGLVTMEIGTGVPVTGQFSSIEWANSSFFIKTEIDPTGGTNYTIVSTSQLLSVPYALFAKTSGTPGLKGDKGDPGDQGIQGISGVKGDPGTNGIDGLTTSVNGVVQVNGTIILTKANIGLGNVNNTSDASKPISSATQSALDLKADKTSLNLHVSFAGDTLYLGNGQYVIIPGITVANPNFAPGANVKDKEGNTYTTVTIGSQRWMAENLKTTIFNDGTNIPLITNDNEWFNLITSPAYCWYDNDGVTYKTSYGAIYNGYAINTGKLCPVGWHVPTNAEWTTLSTYLGGDIVAGGKLKETGTTHWKSPNTGATNVTGFSALPGGHRYSVFEGIGMFGLWWSSTETAGTGQIWIWQISYDETNLRSGDFIKNVGRSVRCLKDN